MVFLFKISENKQKTQKCKDFKNTYKTSLKNFQFE